MPLDLIEMSSVIVQSDITAIATKDLRKFVEKIADEIKRLLVQNKGGIHAYPPIQTDREMNK